MRFYAACPPASNVNYSLLLLLFPPLPLRNSQTSAFQGLASTPSSLSLLKLRVRSSQKAGRGYESFRNLIKTVRGVPEHSFILSEIPHLSEPGSGGVDRVRFTRMIQESLRKPRLKSVGMTK